MRKYTTPDQTAKLIELGFEKPKGWCVEGISSRLRMCIDINREEGFNYSIGELIEMLPQVIESGKNGILYSLRVMPTVGGGWAISYCNEYDERNNELIDALYDMVVKLKEEGVI